MEERSDSNNNDPVHARDHAASTSLGKTGLGTRHAPLRVDPEAPSRPHGQAARTDYGRRNSRIEQRYFDIAYPAQENVNSTTGPNTTSTSGTLVSGTSHTTTPPHTTTPLSRKSEAAVLNHTAARKCFYCGKRFSRLGEFRHHLLSHLRKKAFKCKVGIFNRIHKSH